MNHRFSDLCDSFSSFLGQKSSDWFWMEKKYYGYKKPSFYIIRRRCPKVGLFSYFITNLGAIQKAVNSGYTPIIDMQTYPNTYLNKSDVNKLNAWEYFFEQPCSYGMSDIRFHTRIINSGESDNFPYPRPEVILDVQSHEFKNWKACADQYIRLSPRAKNHSANVYNQLMPKGKRVLGVLCRGTDYTTLHPCGHPVQPTPEMMIDKVKQSLSDHECDYIYLATEDFEICEKFKSAFGDKLIFFADDKIKYEKAVHASDYLPDSTSAKLQKGLAYLTSIVLLTKCNALVAGRTSGTLGALLLPNHFENVFLWNLGLYK